MTTKDLEQLFEKFEDTDEYLKFERITNPLSKRPDLHAFLMLDALFPQPGSDIVSGAEHDVIYLDIAILDMAKRFTLAEESCEFEAEEVVRDLVRCGVMLNNDFGLSMFT